MSQYASLHKSCEQVRSVIVDYALRKIAFEHFKQDRGTAVHKVLPDKSDSYDFRADKFEGVVYPNKRDFTNPRYQDFSITTNNIVSNPTKVLELIDPLYDLWYDTFGEIQQMSSQPSHPGKPPMERGDIKSTLREIQDKVEILRANPSMNDLVSAVESQNYLMVANFLNIDLEPNSLLHPGGPHELTELFTQGKIHIVYQDREIALLKPEYNHEIREKVLNDQTDGFRRIRLRGEQPELAFVVGIDDTPTGLFAHSVDGTRLDVDQDVSKDYIHNVMGFDCNYEHEPVLSCDVGDRVRLQGDLAVEYVDDNSVSDASRCNLPIDNHLCMLNHGDIVDSKDTEPIEVRIPSLSNLNIMHDEHENVSVEHPEGTYRFYLLPRGLQPQNERPDW
jgi:hypothetical protein